MCLLTTWRDTHSPRPGSQGPRVSRTRPSWHCLCTGGPGHLPRVSRTRDGCGSHAWKTRVSAFVCRDGAHRPLGSGRDASQGPCVGDVGPGRWSREWGSMGWEQEAWGVGPRQAQAQALWAWGPRRVPRRPAGPALTVHRRVQALLAGGGVLGHLPGLGAWAHRPGHGDGGGRPCGCHSASG